MRIHFVLIGEGPSDDGLINHLQGLCIESGATEVTGIAPDLRRLDSAIGRTVEERLYAACQLEPEANLFFVHRDADQRDPAPRYAEIVRAVSICGLDQAWVAVVPVQETEAWLLLDERAIRVVAGRPNGREPLNLPHPRNVENVANPKEILQDALVKAAAARGRRLNKFRNDFPKHRRLLLRRLWLGGPLQRVHSWNRLQEDIQATLRQLQSTEAAE
jgi:hypothetical protein